MRTIVTNHLTVFATPDRADIFRIMFTSETPDVVLKKLCAESPVPITIHLTKEVEVTQEFIDSWKVVLEKYPPVRPGSKWMLMTMREVQGVFGASHPIVEPPPFLEHMPTDEGRSRSMEPEIKESEDVGCGGERSEPHSDAPPLSPGCGVSQLSEDEVEGPAPAGVKLPPGAKWHNPTRGYSRNLWEFIPDGTRIWHARPQFACHLCDSAVPHTQWYGQYNATNDVIIGEADGKKYATIGAFANAHMELHGRERQNGWTSCKYFDNGEWKDVGTVKPPSQ